MNCPKCLTPALTGSVFCTECGARLEKRCPACGVPDNPADARFCRTCGEPFPDRSAKAPVRSPAAYTPKYLTDKVLTSRAALEGQRKQVTALFVDVKGSQALARAVDPEVWHQILDGYFEILSAGVHRLEGTINQYTGDGIMALFGAPIAHEDHAQRACSAALALREELAAFAADLRRTHALDFSTRMGLNSGEVVVGRIGDDLRMDYTAQGRTVGLAARMEALAEPGRIYLTKATAALVAGLFDVKDLGRFSVKGEPRSIRVFELRGVGPLRTRFEVSRERGLSPFTDRENELRTLEESLALAIGGEAQTVSITSEAGIGKSRLCWEFAERCRARGIAVLRASAVPQARSLPLVPIVELLRDYFDLEGEADARAMRERIAGRVVLLDERLRDSLPRLFELLRIEDTPPTLPQADPEVRQRELLQLVVDLVRIRSAAEPILIVAEDLPWFDAASTHVIEALARELRDTRTLLLMTARADQPLPFREDASTRRILLEPLPHDATRTLVERLLGAHPSVASLIPRIAERSDGHAFFVEEMIRSLVATRKLVGEEGEYRAAGTVDELSLPATISALLDARIDGLAERERLVLQAASVLGREFSRSVLERVVALPSSETAAALSALRESGLLRATDERPESRSLGHALIGLLERLTGTPRPEEVFEFQHALLQEVAYGSLLAQHRRRLHAEVATALEELAGDHADERAALVAHHRERAGELAAAAEWYARAARWHGANDPAESFRLWQKVRTLCREVDESPEILALAVRAGIQLLNSSWRIGVDEAEVTAIFEETRATAQRSGRVDAIAATLGTFAIVRGMAGEIRDSRTRVLEAEQLAESSGRLGLQVALLAALTYLEAASGDLESALETADRALAASAGDPDIGSDLAFLRPVVFLTGLRGSVLTQLGRLDEAHDALAQAIAISDPQRDAEVAGWIGGWQVELAGASGAMDGAIDEGRRALEVAERRGSPFSRVVALAYLGRAHALRGEGPAAVAALERSLALARTRRTGLEAEAAVLADLAEACRTTGDVERALRLANEAVEVARRRGQRIDECAGNRALARALLDRSGAARRRPARKYLDRALALARETKALALEPAIHVAVAEVARLSGDEPARRAALETAIAICREMGADALAARIGAELPADVEREAPATEPPSVVPAPAASIPVVKS